MFATSFGCSPEIRKEKLENMFSTTPTKQTPDKQQCLRSLIGMTMINDTRITADIGGNAVNGVWRVEHRQPAVSMKRTEICCPICLNISAEMTGGGRQQSDIQIVVKREGVKRQTEGYVGTFTFTAITALA